MESRREPAYFKTETATLFGWVHQPDDASRKNCAVVLCPPLGHEYMTTQRVLRHLADGLAREGYLAVRFDYEGTGDSSGDDPAQLSVKQFTQNVIDVCRIAKTLAGTSEVCCAGFGLGASFAALAAAETPVDHLILWEPCITGRRFVRELKALSGVVEAEESPLESDSVDAAGIFLGASFEAELKELDLLATPLLATTSTLLLQRELGATNEKLLAHLKSVCGVAEQGVYRGYEKMVTQPTDTEVPFEAIGFQVDWLSRMVRTPARPVGHAPANLAGTLIAPTYSEYPVCFGARNELFGIVCEGTPPPSDHRQPGIVFINCGAEHHVGPHRMYTEFSRRLSQHGYTCFRFDLEGIGDSVSIGNNAENYSYSPVAIENVRAALACLAHATGCERFLLTGICAGAYHAFKAAAEIDNADILGSILVNPLVFHWDEERAEDMHAQVFAFRETERYRSSMLSGSKWAKLLSGQVDVTRVAGIVLARAKATLSRLLPASKSGQARIVSRSLQSLRQHRRKIILALAESDPGYTILASTAKKELGKSLKGGYIGVHFIEHANHGLSKRWMREDLYRRFVPDILDIVNHRSN